MVVDLTPEEVAPIGDEEVVVEMNGIVDRQEETCLAEEVILLLEEEDLNILQLVTTLDRNIILVSYNLRLVISRSMNTSSNI